MAKLFKVLIMNGQVMEKSKIEKAIDNATRICEEYKEFGSEVALNHIDEHVRAEIMRTGLGCDERNRLKTAVYKTFIKYFPTCKKVNEMLTLDSGY
ncbi:hypothetical protein ACFL6I_22015 [candidate division KSB1 bacterium]